MNDFPITFWNKIKLRNKPSYLFFILAIVFGLFDFNILGGLLAFAAAWTFERLVPPKPDVSKGVMRNRTKGVINIYAIAILSQMSDLYVKAAELDQLNSVGRAVGVSTEWAIGSSSGYYYSITIFTTFISIWLFVQASLAKRTAASTWRWIFLSFAVVSLPLMHLIFGPLWLLINIALIVVLLVSTFMFRLPREWPIATPAAVPTQLPSLPPTRTGLLEAELVALKRMLDSDLLSQEEFLFQKQEILSRHGE